MDRESAGLKEERLVKTSSEQALLRSIDALKAELGEVKDANRKNELSEQIARLREQLMIVGGRDYASLENENQELRKQVRELEEMLYSVKGKCAPGEDVGGIVSEHETEDREVRLKHKLYKLLLDKYSEEINRVEKKTVGEIKAMIDADDLSLQALLEDFKGERYNFEEGYLSAAKKFYDFINAEIEYVDSDLKINFWLRPKEILSAKIGDDEDLAVFLCSGLYGLGDEKAEVVVAELKNLTTQAFVISEFNGKFILLDPSQKRHFEEFIGVRKAVLKDYDFKGARINRFVYKFNKNNYEQFL